MKVWRLIDVRHQPENKQDLHLPYNYNWSLRFIATKIVDEFTMPFCSTNSTVNSQWQVKFTIKWVCYELVSSKMNQKQKSFNEFQSATGPPVNTDKGERGVGRR